MKYLKRKREIPWVTFLFKILCVVDPATPRRCQDRLNLQGLYAGRWSVWENREGAGGGWGITCQSDPQGRQEEERGGRSFLRGSQVWATVPSVIGWAQGREVCMWSVTRAPCQGSSASTLSWAPSQPRDAHSRLLLWAHEMNCLFEVSYFWFSITQI